MLLIKPSALGDIVQSLPVLSGLRQRWPSASFAWVVNEAFAGLLQGHPDLEQVLIFPRRRGWYRLPHLIAQLRGYDLAIDLQGLMRSAALTWLSGAPRRVGFRHSREGAWLAYTDWLDTPVKQMPAVLANWSAALALGCTGPPAPIRLGITARHRQRAAELLAGVPRPLIAVHAGASWKTKRWPVEHFATLLRLAQERFDAGVVAVGGPGEEPLAARLPAHVNLVGRTDLLTLAAVLQSAQLMLSNDSGPMHLAAALGTPVVAPFTCTSPLRAGPYGQGHTVVATSVPCAASYLRRCPTMHCMQELRPERLWPALARVLAAAQAA
ncbi:MAG: glycosyltransferase family 9 protein [Gemmataceae bacterium]